MMHTVEDTLEILAGIATRKVNIRIDSKEKNLISSLARQVNNNLALTDRQLALAMAKIAKYSDGLTANDVDVEKILQESPLRMPIREIDRSERIYFDNTTYNEQKIAIKFVFSKKIDNIWSTIKDSIDGQLLIDKNVRLIPSTENNLYKVVSALAPLGFEVDAEIQEIYEKIEEILKNSENYIPHLDFENEKYVLKNLKTSCREAIDKNIGDVTEENLIQRVNQLKQYGITHKSQQIIEKIQSTTIDDLTKKIVLSDNSKFRISPEKYSCDEIVNSIKNLNQWPVLVILDDQQDAYDKLLVAYSALSTVVSNNEMTVFFRLSNGQKKYDEFNQFVKDNTLNNYIDESTKVVFISKNRIPKPLFKANWKPQTALVMTGNDYGKISAFLNDFLTVYYYNNSITVRHNKIRGGVPVVEL